MIQFNCFCLYLLLVCLFLTACNSNIPVSKLTKNIYFTQWKNHKKIISQINNYQVRGSFSYVSNFQKIFVRFYWYQLKKGHYRLVLANWMHKTEIIFDVRSNTVKCTLNKNEYYIDFNPEIILKKNFGITISINDLQQWILGLPGNAVDFTVNFYGYIHTINYINNGEHWTIIYNKYYNIKPVLPANLELRNKDVYIKIKIDNWDLL